MRMRNPLRSEADMYRFLWIVVGGAIVIVVAAVINKWAGVAVAVIAFAALFYRVVERRFVSRAHDRAGTVAVQRRRLALSWRRRPAVPAPTTEPAP